MGRSEHRYVDGRKSLLSVVAQPGLGRTSGGKERVVEGDIGKIPA